MKLVYMIFVSLLIFAIFGITTTMAEIIHTKDGETIDAKVVAVTEDTIWYKVEEGRIGINENDVLKILNKDGTDFRFTKTESVKKELVDSEDVKELFDISSELLEPPVDGLYNIGDVAIRFMPREGWKLDPDFLDAGVQLAFTPPDTDMEITTLSITVLSLPDSVETDGAGILKEMIEEDASGADLEITQQEDIVFASANALCVIMSPAFESDMKIKNKQIVFIKKGKVFFIKFIAEGDNFAIFLPLIDESLKTFEII